MPGFFHNEPRRVWPPSRQHRGADPVDRPWGPALQEKQTHLNRLLVHQLPDRAATCCLPMRGLLTDEERAVKERHGSSWTATELPETVRPGPRGTT